MGAWVGCGATACVLVVMGADWGPTGAADGTGLGVGIGDGEGVGAV